MKRVKCKWRYENPFLKGNCLFRNCGQSWRFRRMKLRGSFSFCLSTNSWQLRQYILGELRKSSITFSSLMYTYATDGAEFVVKSRASKCDFYLKLETNFAPCFPLPEVAEIWRFDINESYAALRLLIWFFFFFLIRKPNKPNPSDWRKSMRSLKNLRGEWKEISTLDRIACCPKIQQSFYEIDTQLGIEASAFYKEKSEPDLKTFGTAFETLK
jgi:hypothetical protein